MLNQRKILVSRSKLQAHPFSQSIIAHGGIPIEVPLLNIKCRSQEKTINLNNLAKYSWIFFTSVNGVRCFFKQYELLGMTREDLQGINFAVVGQKTQEALNSYGYPVDFLPSIYNAQTMADTFATSYPEADNILIVQGSRSRPVLHQRLQEYHRSVQRLTVYETVTHNESKQLLNETIRDQIDFITFTSPSTVDAFTQLLEEPIPRNVVYVCIGTTTEKRAHEKGIYHTLTPERFTTEDMISCMIKYIKEEGL